jgi:hypothetical protein
MINLSKKEQLSLDVREAELKDFLDRNPIAQKLQKDLDLKMMGVPDEKRLEVLFMLTGKSLSSNKKNLDSLKKILK